MEEKLISNFRSIGCKAPKDTAVAAQVYLELCEARKYWNVEYFYNAAIQTLYFTARKSKSSPISVFVPVAASQKLSLDVIQKYLDLGKAHNCNVTVAFVEANSTSVCYELSDGLADVTADSSKVNVERRREKLDSDFKRLRPLIEHSALCGLPLPSCSKKDEAVKVQSSEEE